ncbi:hypothetical protein AB0P21_30360 [Kribbella sp. NPDC056861]|uniref:hypothetical protein n=1 Tax=Kribbella sp. NPDC056861 TaxID=3154857 RepID=UPI003443D6B6
MTAMQGGSNVRTMLGYAGLVILALILLNLLVRRLGGWRRLGRFIKRETSRTVHAFVDPIAARIRYRLRVRFLSRILRNKNGWAQAEQAMGYAAAVDPTMAPYALAIAKQRIGVLVVGATAERALPSPWLKDQTDPRLWWIERRALTDYSVPSGHVPAQTPLLACLGTDASGKNAIMIDLLAGPPSLSVYGVPRTAQAVVQALAAQLDVRLPAGAVEVADGVHSKHDGMPLDEAIQRRGAWFVIGAEKLETPVPKGVRLVSLGVGRGSSRLMETTPDHGLRLHGAATWLEIDPLPLAAAVARSVRRMPPHDFETRGPDGPAIGTDDFGDLDLPVGVAGVSVLGSEAGRPTDAPRGKTASWN